MKNVLLLVFTSISFQFSFLSQTCENPCDETFDGGIICCSQAGLSPFDPSNITSSSPAIYGGAVIYKWYKSNINSTWSPTNIDWTAIAASNVEEYNPPVLYANTFYIRVAKKAGCPKFKACSNVIEMSISSDPCQAKFHGGSIASNQSGVMPFTPSTINGVTSATSSSSTNFEYVWLWSNTNTDYWAGGWSFVPDSNTESYTPGVLTQTTYYVRLSRIVGCNDWHGESNTITITVTTPNPVNSCLIYAVQDEGQSTWSQIFTMDPFNNYAIANVGPQHAGLDLEGLEVDPNSGLLFGTSGNDNTAGLSGHFYVIDAVTGQFSAVGPTGYDDVVDLAFHPITNVLYAWCDDFGLLTINTNTGAGTMVLPSGMDMDGLAWSNNGTVLYGFDHDELYSINIATGAITLITTVFQGHNIEALEVRPDGKLMFGVHNSSTNSIYILDPITLQVIDADQIATPYSDIEGIAWPNSCSFNLTSSVEFLPIYCNESTTNAWTVISGGNAPYTFLWSNGSASNQLTGVNAGTYTVTITDAIGLNVQHSITITQPTAITKSIVITAPSCVGDTYNGTIDLNISGGVAPYTYLWSTGATTENLNNVGANWYWYDVYDANGCLLKEDLTVYCSNGLVPIQDQFSIEPLSPIETKVYPQPVSSENTFTFTATAVPTGKYTINLIDANGSKVIVEIEGNSNNEKIEEVINLKNIASGIYMIQLLQNGAITYQKVMVK